MSLITNGITLTELFQPNKLPFIMEHQGWAIVSADRADLGPNENALRRHRLFRVLNAVQWPYYQTYGRYKGVPEQSVLVEADVNQALGLAAMFEQESILCSLGLVMLDRTVQPATGVVHVYERASDDFTRLPGLCNVPFSVDIDWDAMPYSLSDL